MSDVGQLPPLAKRRALIDTLTARIVGLGGIAVIGAIILIFMYLLWVVAPMFAPANMESAQQFDLPPASVLKADVNETGEVGLRFSRAGAIELFSTETGGILQRVQTDNSISHVITVAGDDAMYALLDTNSALLLLRAKYRVSFTNDQRRLNATMHAAFDGVPIALVDGGSLSGYDVAFADEELLVVSLSGNTLTLRQYREAELEYELEDANLIELKLDRTYQHVMFGPRQKSLYLISDTGELEVLNLNNLRAPARQYVGYLIPEGEKLTTFAPLLGRSSWLVATEAGQLLQRFLVRGESGYELHTIREFDVPATIKKLVPEPRRKGFIAIDTNGTAHLGYATTGNILTSHELGNFANAAMAIAPRSDYLLMTNNQGSTQVLALENEHPEISWGTLWSEIWYEGYAEPIHSWQSSSAANDFEPKFSLTPLLFGTIKAAAYALLFAVPIAIMGAIYTAYFMAAPMRALVKPGIEIMAALPTVILGFLAGLWLAPIIEDNLSAVLSVFVTLPVGLFILAWCWRLLPSDLTRRFDGWYGLLVVPPILLMTLSAIVIGPFLEDTLFGGDSRAWFRDYLNLPYDQRNALVVGIAMGLAVIPTIFSIAEDAIYGVPQSLTNGSLALGATPWQTLTRVVLLTASPGIFSAVMIGMGRAVGETMIVLMATGNTPVMDWNIFQGMRTFAANIAVELPEAEVASTHYRILFLAALVLFFITFAFNTFAELVRQRLRARYGSL
jgi:phosphate transport system permease protein